MGVVIEIGNQLYGVEDYQVSEDSTPLVGDDSSGSVGSFRVSTPDQPNIYLSFGEMCLITDDARGQYLGVVENIVRNDSTGLYEITGPGRMVKLNLFNIQAQPFIGTLRNAVAYYLSLAGIEDDWIVEDNVANQWVTAQGWYGELWYHLKQLVIAQGCEIALTGTTIRVRKPRQTISDDGFFADRSVEVGGPDLAQSVEVYSYAARTLEDDVVYPPYNYHSAEDILTFTAGELTEFDLELQASVSRIDTPVMTATWNKDDESGSFFAISKSDGVAITPSEFYSKGGWIEFEIGEDTKSLFIRVYAPRGITDVNGKFVDRFSFSLGKRDAGKKTTGDDKDPEDTGTYINDLPETEFPTIRIRGDGVETVKELHTFITGVPENVTDREVGITVDNPFIVTTAQAQNVGVTLATKYAEAYVTLSGTLTKFRSNEGATSDLLFTYEDFENQFQTITYAQFAALYQDATYDQMPEEFAFLSDKDRVFYVMGQSAGTRVYDEESHHWFRVRSADISADLIGFEAEPDTMVSDVQAAWEGRTYADIQASNAGLTYRQVQAKGLEF